MFYFWSFPHHTYYGNQVETYFTIYAFVFDIMIGSLLKIANLLIVYCRLWVCKYPVAARLYFYENERIFIHGDDV